MRRAIIILGGLLVITAAFYAGVLLRSNDGEERESGDPAAATTIDLPNPSPSGPIEDYLAGPGAVIVEFRKLSEPLVELRQTSADQQAGICEDVAADLDESIKPDDLYLAALRVPDETLAELFINDRAARSDALVSCHEGNAALLEDALLSVEAIDVLIERRMST